MASGDDIAAGLAVDSPGNTALFISASSGSGDGSNSNSGRKRQRKSAGSRSSGTSQSKKSSRRRIESNSFLDAKQQLQQQQQQQHKKSRVDTSIAHNAWVSKAAAEAAAHARTETDRSEQPRLVNDQDPGKKLTSKYRGVCWYKRTKRWVAQIKVNGVRKHIGYFKDEEKAALAYQLAVERTRGAKENLDDASLTLSLAAARDTAAAAAVPVNVNAGSLTAMSAQKPLSSSHA